MEVECPRHPEAFTLQSQLLDETAPMAGKSWQPTHEPHTEGKKGTHYTDIIYTVETRGKGSNLETMLKGRTTNA